MLLNYKKAKLKYWQYARQVRRQLAPRTRPAVGELPVAAYKRSDTLFVLASGGSINEYTPAMWDTIARHDTLGLNLWLYHPFVPTHYLFEIPRYASATDLFFRLLAWRGSDYRHTAILMNDVLAANVRCPGWLDRLPLESLRANFHCLYNTSIRGHSVAQMRRQLWWQTRLGVFDRQSTLWYLPKRRASLSTTIAFGLLSGYQRIILCGVDLTRTDYFYDAPAYQALPVPVWKADRTGPVHSTMDKRLDPITIDEVVYALREVVLARRGVELYVALASSGLHPRVPAFFTGPESKAG